MKKFKMMKILGVVLGLVIVFLLAKHFDIFEYLKDRERFENLITEWGALAPVIYIVIYIIITLSCLSPVPLAIVGGIVFGVGWGIFYTIIGAGLGLSLAFLIARYLAKDFVERKFKNSEIFKKVEEGVKKDSWFILAVTRFLPMFPFGLQNYIYGLTSINFFQYALLSTIFILPGTTVFILLGGAAVSGDIEKAMKGSLLASLILFSLSVIVKIINKKIKL